MSQTPDQDTHAAQLAQRYPHHFQPGRHSLHPNVPPLTPTPTLALLTRRNFTLHKSMYGRTLSRSHRIETWLDGVVNAMEKGELEDPMHKSWDLHSKPEDRIVDAKDRPADEWNNVAVQRHVRRRRPEEYRDVWGSVSERHG